MDKMLNIEFGRFTYSSRKRVPCPKKDWKEKTKNFFGVEGERVVV